MGVVFGAPDEELQGVGLRSNGEGTFEPQPIGASNSECDRTGAWRLSFAAPSRSQTASRGRHLSMACPYLPSASTLSHQKPLDRALLSERRGRPCSAKTRLSKMLKKGHQLRMHHAPW